MCGIFGTLAHKSESIPEGCRLERSARLMDHRGPDGRGVYAEKGIGLVHTRLSLVDPHPRSHQPFWDSGGRYCLVYNGEIYNYRELRKELENERIDFRTTSDTEVLLECLIRYGAEETLRRLEGMFAFALYDRRERTLTLARDRFGIKPLYVYDHRDRFIFASEVAAMRPWIRLEPDLLTIAAYLENHLRGPATRFSFFKRVRSAPPGSVIVVRPGQRTQYRRFSSLAEMWDIEESGRLRRVKAERMIDEVEHMLLESVNQQLLADAPVGAFCSGGVDSSLIVAMASRSHKNLAVFHADVMGPASEREAAAALAKHLKLDLNTVQVTDDDSIEIMPDVIAHHGYPFTRHPESIPFLMVSRLARNHGIKAVLTGEGADECYMGYQWSIVNLKGFLRRIPLQAYQAIPKLIRSLLRRDSRSLIEELRGFAPKGSRLYKPVKPTPVSSLYHRYASEIEYDEICDRIGSSDGWIDDKKATSLHLIADTLRTLLHRNDCLGMAASIESRFPFLDSRLVKLAVNMPYPYKVRFSPAVGDRAHPFLRDKWVLRKVAERYLPAALSERKKRAFPINAHRRMRISAEFFDQSCLGDLFDLDRQAMRYLLDHASRELLGKLMQFEVWAHVCLYDEPRRTILERLRNHITVRAVS